MKEFEGWTPETVDNLAISQLDALIGQIQKRRKIVPSEDVTLERIRGALFSTLGIKEPSKEEDNSGLEQGKQMGIARTVEKDVLEAWIKSGYKGTLNEFEKNFRKS